MPVSFHPNGGIGLKMWTDIFNYSARPSSPVIARFYRSLEGYNYTEPRSVIGTSPVSTAYATSGLNGWAVFPPSAGGGNANLVFTNHTAVLIKRVNATTWMELRWNALSLGRALLMNSAATNPPAAFELWCSHNSSGSLVTTRLATWDYSSVASSSVFNVPYDPLTTPMYLEARMVDNVVSWGMWIEYPGSIFSPADVSSRIETGSYAIPVALQSVIGTAVAGKPGVSLKVDNPNGAAVGGDAWSNCAGNPPFVHYMEFMDASWEGEVLEIPVIGDVDTPPKITLNGLLTDPVITFLIPDEDGAMESTRVILEGTITAKDSITIDLTDGGKITDINGNNRYGMLRPGSRLPMFKPGMNIVSLVANGWDDTLLEHMSVSWRDALR